MSERLKKAAACAALFAAIATGGWLGFGGELQAGGETRTLSLYHTHTKESLKVTYKVNGRYVPSALKKINVLMRDWRRNEVVRMDPKTIDLMWELHSDLGSRRPIHIICGFRSAKTNSFLKRIGRGVAKKSQHTAGKAIDLYFPDVSTAKIRNSAMVRKVGGVGYYRSSGPSGFVHIDSGRVRHWPRMSAKQLAQVMREGRKTVGRRLSRGDMVMVATKESGGRKGKNKERVIETASYEEPEDEIAEVKPSKKSKSKAAEVPAPRPKPEPVTTEEIAEVAEAAYPVPTPRQKPIEILMQAAVEMDIEIEPAAAPPPERTNFAKKPSPVADSLGVIETAETQSEEPDYEQMSNASAKGSFAAALPGDALMIKPLAATASGGDIIWWPAETLSKPAQTASHDDAPSFLEQTGLTATAAEVVQPQTALSGKADMLVVNRTNKGSLLLSQPANVHKRQKLGQLNTRD